MKLLKTYTIIAFAATMILNLTSCDKVGGDFALDYEADPALLPEVSFSASATTIIEGESITFTDTSTNDPSFWTWSLVGSEFGEYTEQSPTVIYTVPGEYDVKLKVRNEYGASEVLLEDYIIVEGEPLPFVSIFRFDGNLEDTEGTNGITAVSSYGDVTYVADRNGNASSAYLAPPFPPYSQDLTIPGYKGVSGDAARSVVAWFKTGAGTGRKAIVGWGTNSPGQMFNVMLQGGQVRVEGGGCSLRTSRTDLMDDQWHHLAVTYDPADGPEVARVKVYIDGALDENLPDAPGQSFNSERREVNTDPDGIDVRIGRPAYRTDYMWVGELDDVAILDIALSPDQIGALAAE
ncbi:PKD domain-containing protein [Hyunsoonleella jejuensis]|uniref:PKD domain-containing protein n=1 Tax=Hyunsoonleella jejuensis TaxID=419940 RepID=A0A1H9CDK4_9FLAO|nr:LamG-like jellyroll fold domain-containing protein [Hyunsoonleella jejuensis]SEP99087.1 PKD domain-containing protein [Hyunsoonleella jejuensis]